MRPYRRSMQQGVETPIPFPSRLEPTGSAGRGTPRARLKCEVIAIRSSRDWEDPRWPRHKMCGEVIGTRSVECDSAWNKDPVFGVIGIQAGPRERWVHIGFRGGHGSRFWDADSGDDCEDPAGLLCPGEADQGDLPRVSSIAEGCAQGDPVAGDRVSVRTRSPTAATDRSVAQTAR